MRLLLIINFAIFLIVVPFIAQAQVNIENPLGNRTVIEIIDAILENFLAPIGFGVAAIMIIWGGILYMTAGGSEQRVATAKKTIMWAIVGFAIVISAKFIVDLIEYVCRNNLSDNVYPYWFCGYHMKESGATSIQEMAFTMADTVAYLDNS